jgi:hypothetical protein
MRYILLLLSSLPLTLAAQNFHFAARAGIANYQGDLQAKAITFKKAKFLGSIGVHYDLTDHITARTYLSFTSLAADDKNGTATMRERNLNFATNLFEWELSAQYNILSLNNSWFTPYVFLGIGVFNYKPYTLYNGNGSKAYLQPLGTEGQGLPGGPKEYKLTQFNIPIGLGALYAVNEDIRVGFELGYRKTFTDYLDDVSGTYYDEAALFAARGAVTADLAYRGDEVGAGPYPPAKTPRGSAKYKDGYYYGALTITVRSFIDQYKRIAGLPSYKRDKKVGCPANRLF